MEKALRSGEREGRMRESCKEELNLEGPFMPCEGWELIFIVSYCVPGTLLRAFHTFFHLRSLNFTQRVLRVPMSTEKQGNDIIKWGRKNDINPFLSSGFLSTHKVVICGKLTECQKCETGGRGRGGEVAGGRIMQSWGLSILTLNFTFFEGPPRKLATIYSLVSLDKCSTSFWKF